MTRDSIYCLIVEDDVYIASFLEEVISDFKVSIKIAKDGKEALEIMAQGNFVDILLTDLRMPKVSGENLIEQITEISPGTLIIVVTGYATISSAIELSRQGIFDYLTKPIELENLTNTVSRAIQYIKKRREEKIPKDITNVWRIGQLLGKDFRPRKFIEEVLNTAVRVSNAKSGAIFLRLENKWHESFLKDISSKKAETIVKKVSRNLVPWQGLKQEEITGGILKIVTDENNIKYLVAPFLDEGNIIGLLLVSMDIEDFDINIPGLLAVFCTEISSTINMCISISKLIHAHEESIKANAAIEKLHEELKQSTKLACLGELASSIAHDINTPLTCISGFIGLFLKFLDKPDITVERLKSSRHYLEKAQAENKRCQGILDNLLMFSRKESKKFKPFSILEVIDRSYSLLQQQLEKKKIEFIKDIPENLDLVTGEANQIQQVIMNLFVNAKNAMSEGGKLTVKTEEKNDKIYLIVEDTGKGIPKDIANKIFDPFFTTNMSGKGTGLGLSISKKIMNEHGGDIKVESVVDKGTTFYLIFPKNNTKLDINV